MNGVKGRPILIHDVDAIVIEASDPDDLHICVRGKWNLVKQFLLFQLSSYLSTVLADVENYPVHDGPLQSNVPNQTNSANPIAS